MWDNLNTFLSLKERKVEFTIFCIAYLLVRKLSTKNYVNNFKRQLKAVLSLSQSEEERLKQKKKTRRREVLRDQDGVSMYFIIHHVHRF